MHRQRFALRVLTSVLAATLTACATTEPGPREPAGGPSDAASGPERRDAAPTSVLPAIDARAPETNATRPADARVPDGSAGPAAGGERDALSTGSDAQVADAQLGGGDGGVQVGAGGGAPVEGCPMSAGTSGPTMTAPGGPWNVGGLGRVDPASRASALPDGMRLVGGLKGGRNFDGKVENRPDEAFYVHKQVEGDLTITARVTALAGLSGFGMAGLMIRADLNPCGLQGSALLNAGQTAIFNCRRNTFPGSSCATKVNKPGAVPGWLRVARAGDLVTASFSTNGTTWTTVGSQTIKLPRTVLAGFLVTHNGTIDISYTNVSITSP